MTTLIGWVGVDSRSPSSVYLASDSRITWEIEQPKSIVGQWDVGKKLFASKKYAEILGYVGDVLFPTQILDQIITQIDNDIFFDYKDSPFTKQDKIFNSIITSFENYPNNFKRRFQVIYFSRENAGMQSVFHLLKIAYDKNNSWNKEILLIPCVSGLIDRLGSGRESIWEWYKRWQKSDVKGTSRSVFSAFCDSLNSGEDPHSGGAPQLVGIYREGAAKSFGIIYNQRRFLHGMEVLENESLNNIEWRNTLFERCDAKTMKRLEGAQPQPKPKNVSER